MCNFYKLNNAGLSRLSRQQVRSAFSVPFSPECHASSRSQRHALALEEGAGVKPASATY